MLKRVTFFVRSVEPTADGWVVDGETGMGPPLVDDAFTFVQHNDGSEDRVTLRVAQAEAMRLRLLTADDVLLREGDILGGEAER